VQLLPSAAQQGAVGGVLHQRVLEEIRGLRCRAAAEQQARLGKPVEAQSQLSGGLLRDWLDQLVAEFAANYRTDLRDLFGDRP
jgi:hypothetical protein